MVIESQSLFYLFIKFKVELSCPKEMAWKVNLYRGYIAICHPEDLHLNMIERLVEVSSTLAIKEWRRLPAIVSHIHVGLLQVQSFLDYTHKVLKDTVYHLLSLMHTIS